MKKFVAIVITYISSFLFCLYISELFCYNFTYAQLYNQIMASKFNGLRPLRYNVPKSDIMYYVPDYKSRDNDEIQPHNQYRPILFAGCSYTYGYMLVLSETLPYKFQEYTGRKSLNTAQNGFGPDNVYAVINYMKKENVLKQENFEYVIYPFMYNQIKRISLNMLCDYISEIRAEQKDKNLISKLKYYADKLYTVKIIECKRFILKKNNLYDYASYIIEKTHAMIKEEIPDVRFILLLYDNSTGTDIYPEEKESLQKETWKHLEKNGITIISTIDLTGDILNKEEYQIYEGKDAFKPFHPNGKAWDLITPILADKIGIKKSNE